MDMKEGSSYKRLKTEKDVLDCSKSSRGVWLVKIPKYISTEWEKAAGNSELGRVKISMTADKKPDISFTLCEELIKKTQESDSQAIPKEHSFCISNIANQTLGVFSQVGAPESGEANSGPSDFPPGKLSLEGHVVQKIECRPAADQKYMNLKRESILKASQPERQVKHLKKIVTSYKPVSDHKHNIEYEQKKKSEGKKMRDDKDKVMDILFQAFEEHQYYNIKDLEKRTKQPVPYLKEILKEICNYNAKNPHKSTWELKPEYRHYKSEAPE